MQPGFFTVVDHGHTYVSVDVFGKIVHVLCGFLYIVVILRTFCAVFCTETEDCGILLDSLKVMGERHEIIAGCGR